MEIARHLLDATAEMEACLGRLAGARQAAEVVGIVREYLSAWPAERVTRMQRLDADWAPFNEYQVPLPVHRPADVCSIHGAVREQCLALRDAGVELTPELLELDHFLGLARERLSELEPDLSRTPAPQPQPRDGPSATASTHNARGQARPERTRRPRHT